MRGAYLPHTHRLKSLLQDVNRSPSEAAATDIIEEKRDPHHENLYKLVRQFYHDLRERGEGEGEREREREGGRERERERERD